MAINTIATPRATSIEWMRRAGCTAERMAYLHLGVETAVIRTASTMQKLAAVGFGSFEARSYYLDTAREVFSVAPRGISDHTAQAPRTKRLQLRAAKLSKLTAASFRSVDAGRSAAIQTPSLYQAA